MHPGHGSLQLTDQGLGRHTVDSTTSVGSRPKLFLVHTVGPPYGTQTGVPPTTTNSPRTLAVAQMGLASTSGVLDGCVATTMLAATAATVSVSDPRAIDMAAFVRVAVGAAYTHEPVACYRVAQQSRLSGRVDGVRAEAPTALDALPSGGAGCTRRRGRARANACGRAEAGSGETREGRRLWVHQALRTASRFRTGPTARSAA